MNKKESFVIQGLAGEKKLKGTIKINGAKNAALKAMAASVLFDGPVTLENIPDTNDIHTLADILQKLGAQVTLNRNHTFTVTIDPSSITSTDIDPELAKTMRGSVMLTGPMLSRFHTLTFPMPGGCVIGTRPIELYVRGYSKMGAQTTEEECAYRIEAPRALTGAEIFFDKVSVGATETLMMAAVLAQGQTVLKNCAMEPEIVNLAEWLNECGAQIKGIGTPTLKINGTNGKLLSPKTHYVAIPDRIEAGSYLLLGALCANELTLENCRPDHLEAVTSVLSDAGVPLTISPNSITVSAPTNTPRTFSIRTHEYPGFPTDLQAQLVTFLTQAEGQSTVFETIFEGRFKYVTDLTNMGASITEMNPREVLIKGPTPLHELPDSEELSAHDIRAGFAIVMAALIGKGKFRINNIHLIDRGYERLEERLTAVGADIVRIRAKS